VSANAGAGSRPAHALPRVTASQQGVGCSTTPAEANGKALGVIARSCTVSPAKTPSFGSGIFTAAAFGSFARQAITSVLNVTFAAPGLL